MDGACRAAFVFLGFRVKRPWAPDPAWFPTAAGVDVVCSVSDCLAQPPPGWIGRWDFNRASCYDTEAGALATIPPDEAEQYVRFAYRLLTGPRDGRGRDYAVDVDTIFDPHLPPLPPDAPPAGYRFLGYDVVSRSATLAFECSPLSCNGMAAEIPVNRFCLLDTLPAALHTAARFDAEQPEPGAYYVVEVRADAGELPRLRGSQPGGDAAGAHRSGA